MRTQDPQAFYEYALLDAVDRPYAVFRYHICTEGEQSYWQAVVQLGFCRD